jgi:hypothetical protein
MHDRPPIRRSAFMAHAATFSAVGVTLAHTPLVHARALAHALGMEDSLLRYEGGGHTAFFKGIACIDSAIERYLIDRELPPPGSSCPAQPVNFGTAARPLSGAGGVGVAVETGLWSGSSPLSRTMGRR